MSPLLAESGLSSMAAYDPNRSAELLQSRRSMAQKRMLNPASRVPLVGRQSGIEREQLLGTADAAQGVASKQLSQAARHVCALSVSPVREVESGIAFRNACRRVRLHVEKLIRVLHRLVDAGNTIDVMEHNFDVIADADRIVDLGLEGGDTVIVRPVGSHTATLLAEFMAKRGNAPVMTPAEARMA